jgi:glycosyltransferase involved in cell wall biosynthesis
MRQIDFCCYANRSGYAQAASDYINVIKTLNRYELKVTLFHSSPDQLALTPSSYSELMRMIRLERQSNAIQMLHCVPGTQHRLSILERNIGFATFETFEPPLEWTHILNANKAIVCPSTFNMKIFKKAGITVPMHYIPHCFDENLYNINVCPKAKSNDSFTFLFLGTWRKRKGWDILLEAWIKEFDSSDNVNLMIKTDKYTLANASIAQKTQEFGLKKDIAPILLEGRVLNDVEMPHFLKGADCFVSPTLGEGFGIPGLQCMALGVPVIITNCSGCTDYANQNTATLIEPDGYQVIEDMDGIPQMRMKKWAHLSVASIRAAMRYVVDNKTHVQNKAQLAAEYVKNKFSYKAIAPKFGELLDGLI